MERTVLKKLYVVGIGPGAYEKMTIEAAEALKNRGLYLRGKRRGVRGAFLRLHRPVLLAALRLLRFLL